MSALEKLNVTICLCLLRWDELKVGEEEVHHEKGWSTVGECQFFLLLKYPVLNAKVLESHKSLSNRGASSLDMTFRLFE